MGGEVESWGRDPLDCRLLALDRYRVGNNWRSLTVGMQQYSYRPALRGSCWRVGKGCRLHSTGECATIGNVQKPYSWRVGKGCRLHSTGECATIGNVLEAIHGTVTIEAWLSVTREWLW